MSGFLIWLGSTLQDIGAALVHIGFDYADGFNCRACGKADSDE